MLRASNIPPLLSRITGDGIHTALLVTSDGELLGSSSTSSYYSDNNNIASVGSLIAEVASEYKRAGNDLSIILRRLKGTAASTSTSTNNSNSSSSTANATPLTQSTGGTSTNRPTNGGARGSTTGAAPLKCLIVEFEKGIAGAASTGSNTNCLVVALAESTVEIGLIRARLTTLASVVGEALNQLAEPP